MSSTQILLIFSVTILTVVLTVIGVYVALVLKEVRENMKKIGPILDNVIDEQAYLNDILETAKNTTDQASESIKFISENVIEPIGGIVSFLKVVQGFMPQKKRSYDTNDKRSKEESNER